MRSSAISIENRTFASSFDGDQYHYICICKLRIRCLGHLSMFCSSKIQPTSKWSFQIFCMFNPTWGEIQCNVTLAYFSNGLKLNHKLDMTIFGAFFLKVMRSDVAGRDVWCLNLLGIQGSKGSNPSRILLRLRSGRSSPKVVL